MRKENLSGGRMRQLLSRIVTGWFLLLLPFTSISAADGHKEILIVHSYSQGLEWTDNITMGILSTLANSEYSGIMFHIEYLDTKSYFSPQYLNQLFDIFQKKFKDKHFDVIISSDDDAFNFLLDHQPELFPNTPVVFCGVNYLDPAKLRDKPLFTGIEEEYDLEGTIRLMLKLHPLAKKIFVVNDKTTTGEGNLKRLEKVMPLFAGQVEFVFSEDLVLKDLLKKLGALTPDTLVLLLTYNRDKAGVNYSYTESGEMISKDSPVPVYVVWDFYLGKGVVGGLVTSGFLQGKMAAQMAIKILNGESVTNIPVVQEDVNQYMFDYEQLMKFFIPLSEIPEKSVIVNRPLSFYEQNKILVWVIGAGIFGLLAALGILYIVQQRTRKAYLHSEDRYKKLAQASHEGIVLHMDQKIIDVNDSYARMTGYKVLEMIGMNIYNIIAVDDRERVSKLIEGGFDQPFELKLLRKDGSIFWAEANGRNMKYNGGVLRVAAVRDITDEKKSKEAMKRWFDFERTVSSVLSHYIGISDIDTAINASLAELGLFIKADRVYVFMINTDGSTMDNTHEWCVPGVDKQIDNLKNMSVESFPWWDDRLKNGETILIEDVSLLPPEAIAEKQILEAQGILALAVVPVRRGKNVVGFVGVDNTKTTGTWSDDYIAILRLFAEVLGKVLSTAGK
jgi:PAS domain S-box-containing protein